MMPGLAPKARRVGAELPVTLSEELRALGGLRSRFQPIVELHQSACCTGQFRMVGLECLTRGPSGSAYESAGGLFAEARRRGEAAVLDQLCIEQALDGAALLSVGALGEVDLFFNVHASTLESSRHFARDLERVAAHAGFPMGRIIVEVIESEPMLEAAAFQVAIHCLRRAGARIALDDVGQGFATNRLILAARPDFIKLDRFLVCGAFFDCHRRALISSYQHMAEELGIRVIAEGVESCTQVEALRRIGVSLCQGYLFAAPLTPSEILERRVLEGGVPYLRPDTCGELQ